MYIIAGRVLAASHIVAVQVLKLPLLIRIQATV